MREACRYIDLAGVLGAQLECFPSAERRRVATDVDHDIPDGTG
jgi:hypothetical protein